MIFNYQENHLKVSEDPYMNKNVRDDKLKCKICNKVIDRERMRTHKGFHILSNHISQTQETCGFCGLTACKINLTKTSGILSNFIK